MDSALYLLDSSIWITVLRRDPPPEIAHRFNDLMGSGCAVINEIVRLEILMGYGTEAELKRVQGRLSGMTFLRLAESTWGLAARLNLQLRSVGATTSFLDLVIAATAIENDVTLIHQDSDFDNIARHTTLRVESYADAA